MIGRACCHASLAVLLAACLCTAVDAQPRTSEQDETQRIADSLSPITSLPIRTSSMPGDMSAFAREEPGAFLFVTLAGAGAGKGRGHYGVSNTRTNPYTRQ